MTTFIVPVRNDVVALTRCLQSIRRHVDRATARVVVVDNGSCDNSAEAAQRLGADVLHLPELNVGALRNRGAASTRGDALAFVDADHELGPGWLDAALETLGRPEVAAVGAPYSPPPSPTWVQRMYDAFRDHRPGVRSVAWLGAGNLVVRASAFHEVGGFDESLAACEDVDLCQRLSRRGFTVACDPRMASIHHGDPRTLKALFKSELWRGRDNLRVTLRGPLTPASLPSIFIPAIDLIALGVIAVGMLVQSFTLPSIALVVAIALSSLRAAKLYSRLHPRSAADLVRAFLVAAVYDCARALALVTRVGHRRAGARGAVAAAR